MDRDARAQDRGGAGPRFSVIVPSRDRPGPLERCLRALARLEYERDAFEVVVVDNRGNVPLTGLLERFRADVPVRLVEERLRGPAAARNAGAAAAAGRFLAFTDDDCEPAPTWLAALDRRLARASDSVVGGSLVNALPDNPYSNASQIVMDAVYRHYNSASTARFLASNNLALPASLFRELGGFDTSFPLAAGEDREFCDRCESEGRNMIYAPEAVVAHAHELTLRSLWRQHFNYGRGTSVFHDSRRDRGLGRVAFEPGLHTTLVRTAVATPRGGRRLRVLGAVLLTQFAYAAGFLRELPRGSSEEG